MAMQRERKVNRDDDERNPYKFDPISLRGRFYILRAVAGRERERVGTREWSIQCRIKLFIKRRFYSIWCESNLTEERF